MNTNTEEWGNIELPGLSDEILFKKNWNLSQSKDQRIANQKRNKDRWLKYDNEYRKQWGETSTKSQNNYWSNLSEEEYENRVQSLQIYWDSVSEEGRKLHGEKTKKLFQDLEYFERWYQASSEAKGWREKSIYLEVYNKSITVKRYQDRNIYSKLSKEYNIPVKTLYLICNNHTNIVSDEIHKSNMDKIRSEWQNIKNVRAKSKKDKGDQWRLENRYQFEILSPGYQFAELYDYYNSLRTSNQRMPVSPSLIYMFRELKFTAKEAKEFCKIAGIYESNDASYWHKLVKFSYPWYSENPGEKYVFDTAGDAIDFLESKGISGGLLHQYCDSGLKKFGHLAGWIFRKTLKKDI